MSTYKKDAIILNLFNTAKVVPHLKLLSNSLYHRGYEVIIITDLLIDYVKDELIKQDIIFDVVYSTDPMNLIHQQEFIESDRKYIYNKCIKNKYNIFLVIDTGAVNIKIWNKLNLPIIDYKP